MWLNLMYALANSKRKAAEGTLKRLSQERGTVFVVHYSCESFYDRPNGFSPRITSLACRNLATAQTRSFSIHQVAELQGIAPRDIPGHYDQLERVMLDQWYQFVGAHATVKWLHWNMRDANYGFPALAHRYRVLGGQPVEIGDHLLFDFARLLIDVYGPGYTSHPRLQSLCTLNKVSLRDFLSGAEEAAAFEGGDYVKLHQSTLRKVDAMANLFARYEDGRLKTLVKWWEPYRSRVVAVAELCKEHPFITLVLALIGAASGVLAIIQWIWGLH